MIKNETFKKYLALKDRREGDKDKQKLNLHHEKLICFFDTRLFFDVIHKRKSIFSQGWGQKITTSLFFFTV